VHPPPPGPPTDRLPTSRTPRSTVHLLGPSPLLPTTDLEVLLTTIIDGPANRRSHSTPL
ncbi:hypothetical protein A2U01_0053174, partial [Trifolium medium]|nr:hypothetical protein [Trifolium medium]